MATLPLLLPKLCKLVLDRCNFDNEAMGILATLSIQNLEVGYHKEEGGDKLFAQALARFTSLARLSIRLFSPLPHPSIRLCPLATLSKLESLAVDGCGCEICVEGLESVLELVPLRHLSLACVVFPSPAPIFRSATLRSLDMFLNDSLPDVAPQDFPKLVVLQLHGVCLRSIKGRVPQAFQGAAPDQLLRLGATIMSLARFPSCVLAFPEEGKTRFRFVFPFASRESPVLRRSFTVSVEMDMYYSSSVFLDVLRLLPPLAPVMASVEQLHLLCNVYCEEGLRTAASLFPGLVHMDIMGRYTGAKVSDAVVLQPGLQVLSMEVEQAPEDVIACLVLALTAGRSFRLELVDFSFRDPYLRNLGVQWDNVQSRLPAASSVDLRVYHV